MVSLRLLIFILVLINISCYTPYYYRNQLKKLEYNGKSNITDKVFTDGYYYALDSSSQKTTPYTLMLFKDGTFLQHLNFNNFTHQIDSELYFVQKKPTKERYNIYNLYRSWGFYKIINDTIKGNIIHPYGGMSLYLYDVELRILNDSTIERISYNYNPATVSSVDLEKSNELFRNDSRRILRFKKVECIPVFNPWLKQKRWFWADKKAYKEYRKKLKTEKLKHQ